MRFCNIVLLSDYRFKKYLSFFFKEYCLVITPFKTLQLGVITKQSLHKYVMLCEVKQHCFFRIA